ncbi:DUF305 domain-containing protein [Nocardioides sp.]|uniref:DUF305 domain-containing protein n=1 Tax=Nocardioides sp. TaxID=35761 RepID=UPI00286A2F61|nr:DUF305 domain-containing protein [Nocardioides sp.]
MRTIDKTGHRAGTSLAALTLGLSLALTACGGDDTSGSSSTSSSDHNDADVSFASDMIQHHAQALTMVDLTVERDLDPAFQQVAEGIRDAQGPEIETMSNWLEQWGEEVPATVRDHSNAEGHDMGDMADDTGMDMPGMMSDEDLEELADASDADFEDLWLEMMIEHHEGAVSMAQTEQKDGTYEPAVSLAEDIVTTQTDEIATMQELLDS